MCVARYLGCGVFVSSKLVRNNCLICLRPLLISPLLSFLLWSLPNKPFIFILLFVSLAVFLFLR